MPDLWSKTRVHLAGCLAVAVALGSSRHQSLLHTPRFSWTWMLQMHWSIVAATRTLTVRSANYLTVPSLRTFRESMGRVLWG